jgi:8-oxo-dGTP pyrophosphatase MutT (NUDIX family)
VIRPSAYALVRNTDGAVAVVCTARGCFLPGGGIEVGESPGLTIEREALEECGLVLRVRAVVGAAVEIGYSPDEDTCFEKQSTFVEADLQSLTAPQEPDHELVWLTRTEAAERLSHGSHRWALELLDGAAA